MKKEFVKKTIIVGIATLMITNMYCIPASAKWINNSKDKWSWVDGEIKATGWKEIDKKWYYFREDGVMSTGWLNYNEKWYNLSSSGIMETGWKEINEKWYHFNTDGVMNSGWINDNGTWYYTNSSGEMETGTLGIDGKVYIFSNSGVMLNDKETIQNTQPGLKAVSNVKNDKSDKSDKSDDNERVAYVSTNSNSLNIRLEASISSDIIGTALNGQEIKIIDDEKDGFYHIIANGTKGFVKSSWVSFEKPKQKPINQDTNTNSNIDLNEDTSTSLSDDSKEESKPINDRDSEIKEIRDTAPSLDNKHYYSDGNLFYKVRLSPPFFSGGKLIQGNCTWYAWGRAWEIIGSKPEDAGFRGNAYEWWEANKKSGKYQYGSEPRVGSIAVWKAQLPNSGACGHVAIVEKIQDGKTYISESMWHGVTFKYREIYETSYLYGYIYLDKPNY